jgi:hypothetical protein
MDFEKLIALAESLNVARYDANAIPEVAPQDDAYGDIAEALKKVLRRIVGTRAEAERVYDLLIDSDEPVRNCLIMGYETVQRGMSDSWKVVNQDGETVGRVYLDAYHRYSPEPSVDRVLPLQQSMAAAIFALAQHDRHNR